MLVECEICLYSRCFRVVDRRHVSFYDEEKLYTPRPCFKPFCCKGPYNFRLLLDLRPFIFGLTLSVAGSLPFI